MAGTTSKYRFDVRLGGGGMAEVFAGSTLGAEGFTRKVAIKRVLPGFAENPQFAQMFVAEAKISSRLVHPNIVSVMDFDRDDAGGLFLVMELVEGRDLDALAQTGLLPFEVVVYLIAEVLRGLGYAHDLPVGGEMRGVIHRDVSPHNVLLSWEGAVKVSDFGIAKARSASEATASQFIKGKPAYMSPEQANGQALDGRSDLFAVGVMMWEMLVGRRLFIGDDTRATLAAVLFGQIPRPRQLRGDVPKDLERITMKLLERDLPARYPNAEAAIVDLMAASASSQGGRDALIEILQQRFPQQASVRKNRSRSGVASGNVATPVSMQPTLPGGNSIGVVRAAATTIGRKKPPNVPMRIALAVLVAGAAGTAVFLAVSSGKTASVAHDAGVPRDAAGLTPADAALADAPTDAPMDAAIADAAVPPPDAPPAVKKGATISPPVHAAHQTGHLHVDGYPIRTVYLDGSKLGDMPIDREVPAGKHMLRFTTIDENHVEQTVTTRPVDVPAGKQLEVHL